MKVFGLGSVTWSGLCGGERKLSSFVKDRLRWTLEEQGFEEVGRPAGGVLKLNGQHLALGFPTLEHEIPLGACSQCRFPA